MTGAVALMAAGVATFQLSNYDIWWHLAAGRWMVAHRAIARHEAFSFTAAGRPWIDHEWLFQLAAWAVHALGGVAGLILAKAAVVAATVALVHRFMVRKGGLTPAAAGFVLIPFVVVSRLRLLVRPEIASLLFAVILLSVLLTESTNAGGMKRLLWIPALMVLWANVHAGVALGLMLLAVTLVGAVLEGAFREPPRELTGAGRLAVVSAASVAAVLVNPWGWRVLTVPFRLTSMMAHGPFHNWEWQPSTWEASWPVLLLVVASTAVAVASVIRRPAWRPVLVLTLLAFLVLRYRRNLAVFCLLAPIPLSQLAAEAWPQKIGSRFLTSVRPALVAGLLVVVGFWGATAGWMLPAGLGVNSHDVPVGAVNFLARVKPPGNPIHPYDFGGYLAWRLGPATKIFMDGRNEIFVDLRREIAASEGNDQRWRQLLDHWRIDWALMPYSAGLVTVRVPDGAGGPQRYIREPRTVFEFPRNRWALVWFDDCAMVLLRRTSSMANLIERYEMADVYPELPDYQLEAFARGTADPVRCLNELSRFVRAAPDCRRARRLLELTRSYLAAAGRPVPTAWNGGR